MSLLVVFRYIAILEGISYLLFGITMPLKYKYEIMEPNYYVGLAHGMLFLLYCVFGLSSALHYKWKFGFSVMAFLASLVPFGTFYLEAKYLKQESKYAKTVYSRRG
jgi:integral membrane protein